MKRIEINEVVNPQGTYSLKKIELPSYLMNMPETMREAVYGIEKIEDDIIFLEIKEVENNLFMFPMVGKVGVDMETFRKYWDELVEEAPEKSNASFYFHAKGHRKDSDGYYEWRTNGRRTYVKFYPADSTIENECYKSRSTCHKADLSEFDVEFGVELAYQRAKMKYIKEKINRMQNYPIENTNNANEYKANQSMQLNKHDNIETSYVYGAPLNGKDLTHMQFEDLKVKKFTGERDSSRHNLWECECKCGKTVVVSSSDLLRGRKTCCAECKEKKLNATKTATTNTKTRSFKIGDEVVYRHSLATIIDFVQTDSDSVCYAIIKYKECPVVEAVTLNALTFADKKNEPAEKDNRHNIW